MVQISKKDKEKVLESIHSGEIGTAGLTMPALADSVVLAIKHHGFLELLNDAFKDKRSDNLHIPSNILLILAITAKPRQKTSLTDIPFAVTDTGLLAELGWNAWDYGCNVNDGLFSESVIRKLVRKYNSEELVHFYKNPNIELCNEMLKNTSCLNENDVPINVCVISLCII